MIKTLRTTSILTAALAVILVGFFVFRIVHGVRNNETIKEFLSSPGVIEKFKTAEGNRTKIRSGQSSPLVQQAQAFALYLNPPAPKAPKNIITGRSISPQVNVTPKFKVIGTSYYKQCPALSLALIDEPGKGIHWVKQSTTVGHLLIEQVKDGLVIVKGDTETFELVAERRSPKSPSSSSSNVPKKPANSISPRSRMQLPSRARNLAKRVPSKSPQPQRTDGRNAKLEELYENLKKLKTSPDITDSELSEEERAKQIEKIISSFKASYVSPEEAKKLDDLGEKLKEGYMREPNLVYSEDE